MDRSTARFDRDPFAVESLADELSDLKFERTNTKGLKSSEELELFTVDERLNDVDRAIYILSSSRHEVQRLSVVTNLPDLLEGRNGSECLRKVVPRVTEVLDLAHAEIQIAASTAFLQILQKELVPVQNYAQTFLHTILVSIDSKDPEIADAWLDTLLDVIDLLPKDVIKKEILSAAVAKGQLSQSVPARLACCRILGKIATKFEPFVIKKEILPVVQSLCQDVDYEVRGCMCKQLDPVARGLGLEATKSAILPELVELTNDEESYVRVTGLETVVNILSLLDDETCVNTIIPLACKFYEQCLELKDDTLPMVARQIGRLCHGLSVNLDDDQKKWFLECFRTLCSMGLEHNSYDTLEMGNYGGNKLRINVMLMDRNPFVECRTNAAFNFPSMVMLAGLKEFQTELKESFSNLCKDPSTSVRKTIASGFHEIAKLLGSSLCNIMVDFLNLIRDGEMDVLRNLNIHISDTFEMIGKNKFIDPKHHSDIIPALMAAEIEIFSSNDWRLQESFILNFSSLPKCFDYDIISSKIIPFLYKKLKTSRALPVRNAVARTFLIILRSVRKLEKREELFQKLINDFCYGKSYQHRLLFLQICQYTLELYSKSFFKEHFFNNVLEMHQDPVPNVRIRLCRIFAGVKRTLKSPSDDMRLNALNNTVSKILIHDKDIDVTNAVKEALSELDHVLIPIDRQSADQLLPDYEDIEDQRRAEEEKNILEPDSKFEEKFGKPKKEVMSKIPSPRKQSITTSKSPLVVPATEKKSIGSLKESKRSLSSSSTGLQMSPTRANKGKYSPIPNSRLVKSRSTSSIATVSHIPRRDVRHADVPAKRESKIPTINTSVCKDSKGGESRVACTSRIPRVSACRSPSPITGSVSAPGKPPKNALKSPNSNVQMPHGLSRRNITGGSSPSVPRLSTSASSGTSATDPSTRQSLQSASRRGSSTKTDVVKLKSTYAK